MTAAIVAQGVSKRFGPVLALDDLSLTVEEGEIVALVGPNGAGKSTLLRVLATVLTPDSGSASVAGHDVLRSPRAARERAGLVFGDERTWYWRLSGRQNLEFFGSLYGLPREIVSERAIELMEAQGLADAVDRRVSDYSSGMRLRLALARALLTKPSVLLLDEPTRSLDPEARDAFEKRLVDLSGNDVTTLFTTHDMEVAQEITDRTLVMHDGRIVESDGGRALDDFVSRTGDLIP